MTRKNCLLYPCSKDSIASIYGSPQNFPKWIVLCKLQEVVKLYYFRQTWTLMKILNAFAAVVPFWTEFWPAFVNKKGIHNPQNARQTCVSREFLRWICLSEVLKQWETYWIWESLTWETKEVCKRSTCHPTLLITVGCCMKWDRNQQYVISPSSANTCRTAIWHTPFLPGCSLAVYGPACSQIVICATFDIPRCVSP